LSDALASVAVIIGGTLIILYDLRWVDPAITIGIALYILYLALTEIGGPIRMLMLGSPPDMDAGAVVDAMTDVDGVRDVHHVHLWQMQEHEVALDCHVVLMGRDWTDLEAVKQAVKKKLADDFGITHSSLEFETSDNAHQGAALFGHKDGGNNAGEEPGA
ncbi:cation transporter, partial [Rhodobacteraceae bacterium R_SAG2]|nr:cation transporter [Rhodobacteraceae bacterium R_SAG2]